MITALNVAHLCPATWSLGPGKRFAIWVQGCPFNCADCIAPDWIPIKPAHPVDLNMLAGRILAVPDLEGLTISGGEPMLQAGPLSDLLFQVRTSRPGLSVIAYSGFTLEQLTRRAKSDAAITSFLGQLDVLVDGLYLGQENNGRGLRGSRNQVVHFMTPRYEHLREQFENGCRQSEMHLLSDGVLIVGIPRPETLARQRSIVRDIKTLSEMDPPAPAR